MITTRRWPVLTWIGIAMALIANGPSWARMQEPTPRQIDQIRNVASDVRVELTDLLLGHLTVTGWHRDELQVRGTVGADVESLAIEGGPDAVRIRIETQGNPTGGSGDTGRTRRRSSRHGSHDVDVDLEIHVPVGARLRLEGVTAGFEISGVNGSVRIQTVTGKIQYQGGARRIELTTVTGDIAARAEGADEVRLETVQGDIEFVGTLTTDGELSAEAVGGSIDLTLPADISAQFHVTTTMGKIDSEFGGQPASTSRWVPSEELRFRTGAGDAEISAETLQGRIRLRKQ